MKENNYTGEIQFGCSLCNGIRTINFSLRTIDGQGYAIDSGNRRREEYAVFITADQPDEEIFGYLIQRHNNHFHEGELFDPNCIVDMRN